MTNKRVVYTSPIIGQEEESLFAFGPILEEVGPIGGTHDLIGNSAFQLLPLQGPSFKCFIDNGDLAFGEAGSPCFTLSTKEFQEAETPLIYPNLAINELRWNESIEAIRIFDATGKLVLVEKNLVGKSFLATSTLEIGFYAVVFEKYASYFSQKLIVE